MKKRLVLCCWSLLISSIFAQDRPYFLEWEKVRNSSPDSVYYVSFSRLKLTELPDSLALFRMLKGIDLSGNKLQDLPSFFALFDSLSYLDLSKNKFTIFPLELCSLTNLKQLIFNRNSFEELPDCVRYLTNLELLDLWSTPVHLFSEGFLELKNIRRIDLQGNRYSPSLQTKLKNHFPNAQILMDSPCDCME